MDEERTRILRMLAEGKITTDECEELIDALAHRREAPKPDDAVEPDTGRRAKWPYVLLILLCVPAALALLSLVAGITIPVMRRTGFFLFPFTAVTLPAGVLGMVGFIFWIWMIIDCLGRAPYDFRLLFTQRREHDKWIWIAIVVLTHWIGALIYFLLIRQPARSVMPLAPPRTSAPPPARDADYVPPRRARSLGCLLVLCVIAFVPALVVTAARFSAHTPFTLGLWRHHTPSLTWFLIFAPLAFAGIVAALFWLSMLISCLARDYRDFGTIIPSDPAADKVVWLLIVLLLPVIGAIAYHISIRRRVRVQPST